jgi:hypothetical protein
MHSLSEVLNVMYNISKTRSVDGILADLDSFEVIVPRIVNILRWDTRVEVIMKTTIVRFKMLCCAFQVLQTTFTALCAKLEGKEMEYVADLKSYTWFLFLQASHTLLGPHPEEIMAVKALVCYCATFVLTQANAFVRGVEDWIPTMETVKVNLCQTHNLPFAQYEVLESEFMSSFLVSIPGTPIFKYRNLAPLSDVLPWGRYEGALDWKGGFLMMNLEQIRNRYAAGLHEGEEEVDARILIVETRPMGTFIFLLLML